MNGNNINNIFVVYRQSDTDKVARACKYPHQAIKKRMLSHEEGGNEAAILNFGK